MTRSIPPRRRRAVQGGIRPLLTFDAGQTLVELDLDFLARRLAERGVIVEPARLGEAVPAAWERYDALVQAGAGHPWQALMTALLEGARVPDPAPLVEWLWAEQPRANLWRRPMPAMLEVARELAARGAIVGVLSNSEGRLAELFEEIAIAAPFAAIIDSGRVGIEKPDPRIFEYAARALGVPGQVGIHVGDSWAADVEGALAAGWRAIWFGRQVHAVENERVAIATDAHEVRAALARWGILD